MAASKTRKRRVTFEHCAPPGSEVYLTGSAWQWDPAAKKMKSVDNAGHYSTTVYLPRGLHEYKFVVNGTWCADGTCNDWVVNSYGTLNNIIEV